MTTEDNRDIVQMSPSKIQKMASAALIEFLLWLEQPEAQHNSKLRTMAVNVKFCSLIFQ